MNRPPGLVQGYCHAPGAWAALRIPDNNRRLNREGFDDQTDELWARIDDGTPAPLDLERSPKGETGHCWPGENPAFRQPIDFFLFNEDMWPLVVKDALGTA